MADKEPLLDVSRGDSGEEEVASSKKGASTVATFLFFLKSYLGSGIMGMAGAYLNGGIYPVTILVFSMAVLSGLCFLMLFHVRDDILASKKSPLPRDQLQFEAIVAHVLGKWGGRAVMAAVIFTQAGFATAYIIFIGSNLRDMYPAVSFPEYALIQIVPLTALCLLRDIKYISPFAMAGIVAIALAVFTVLYYAIKDQLIPNGTSAFGVAVYLFEGIGLVIPLESKMRHPQHFKKLLWAVNFIIALAVTSFGLAGYLAWGPATQAPIVKNLPSGGWLVGLTLWSLCVALFFTYPVQMFPVFEMVDTGLRRFARDHSGRFARLVTNQPLLVSSLARFLIVCLSAAAAIGIPQFDYFLSLIGGLGSAQLMFIFPPLTYFYNFRGRSSLAMRVACWSLFVFGLAAAGVTTAFTLKSIIEAFRPASSSES